MTHGLRTRMNMPLWIQAGLWGLVGGSALLLGAGIGYRLAVPHRAVAGVMAFGSGVLISTLCFELMDEAYRQGGFTSTSVGFALGAAVYTIANHALSRRGAKHRKRSSSGAQPRESEQKGSGMAIAVGALLDGIPESMVIGMGFVDGGAVGLVTVIAVFLSNFPEGLSSAAGMKRAGRSGAYVFGLWGGIALVSGVSAVVGYAALQGVSPAVVAATTAIAAGAILAMLVDTMIPEAFAETRDFAGAITAFGFLTAFYLSKVFS